MTEDKGKFTIRIDNTLARYSAYAYELRVIGPIGETRHRKRYKSARGVLKACEELRDAGYTVPDAEWDKIALD